MKDAIERVQKPKMKIGDGVTTKMGTRREITCAVRTKYYTLGARTFSSPLGKCDAHGAHVGNVLFWLNLTGKVVLWEEKEDECCGKVWVFLIFS